VNRVGKSQFPHLGKFATALTSGRVAAIALVSILLGSLAAQGVSTAPLLVLACTVVFCYVVFACGRLLLRAARASDLPLIAAWPLGVTATGLALLVLVTLLSVTAAAAFALWAATIVALDIATARLCKHQPAADRADLVGLVLCCVFTAMWCKDVAAAPAFLAHSWPASGVDSTIFCMRASFRSSETCARLDAAQSGLPTAQGSSTTMRRTCFRRVRFAARPAGPAARDVGVGAHRLSFARGRGIHARSDAGGCCRAALPRLQHCS
jgi:hypothetical protein